MNKKMEETAKKMIEVLDFVKEAFCIDGEIEVQPAQKYSFEGVCMKLTDSKRGTFYVAIIPENKLKIPDK